MAAERRLLSHRSGDLAPISLISHRMGGEGSGRGRRGEGGDGGLPPDLFSVKTMMARRSEIKAEKRVVVLKT